MITNEIKKGTRILLKNGFYATMMDNKRGNVRLCEVYGYHTEMGSVYAHDITKALVDGLWMIIQHTDDQHKLRSTISVMFK